LQAVTGEMDGAIHTAGAYCSDLEAFNAVVRGMVERALTDMRGEGFLPEQITFSIEAELSLEGTSHCALVCLATGSLQGDSLASMCSDFMGQLGHPREKSPGNIMLDVLRLKAQCPTRHYVTATFEPLGENPEAAFKGTRLALLDISLGFREVPVYEQSRLKCGNTIGGPAILDSDDTTVLVPAHRKYAVDKHLNGVIQEA